MTSTAFFASSLDAVVDGCYARPCAASRRWSPTVQFNAHLAAPHIVNLESPLLPLGRRIHRSVALSPHIGDVQHLAISPEVGCGASISLAAVAVEQGRQRIEVVTISASAAESPLRATTTLDDDDGNDAENRVAAVDFLDATCIVAVWTHARSAVLHVRVCVVVDGKQIETVATASLEIQPGTSSACVAAHLHDDSTFSVAAGERIWTLSLRGSAIVTLWTGTAALGSSPTQRSNTIVGLLVRATREVYTLADAGALVAYDGASGAVLRTADTRPVGRAVQLVDSHDGSGAGADGLICVVSEGAVRLLRAGTWKSIGSCAASPSPSPSGACFRAALLVPSGVLTFDSACRRRFTALCSPVGGDADDLVLMEPALIAPPPSARAADASPLAYGVYADDAAQPATNFISITPGGVVFGAVHRHEASGAIAVDVRWFAELAASVRCHCELEMHGRRCIAIVTAAAELFVLQSLEDPSPLLLGEAPHMSGMHVHSVCAAPSAPGVVLVCSTQEGPIAVVDAARRQVLRVLKEAAVAPGPRTLVRCGDVVCAFRADSAAPLTVALLRAGDLGSEERGGVPDAVAVEGGACSVVGSTDKRVLLTSTSSRQLLAFDPARVHAAAVSGVVDAVTAVSYSRGEDLLLCAGGVRFTAVSAADGITVRAQAQLSPHVPVGTIHAVCPVMVPAPERHQRIGCVLAVAAQDLHLVVQRVWPPDAAAPAASSSGSADFATQCRAAVERLVAGSRSSEAAALTDEDRRSVYESAAMLVRFAAGGRADEMLAAVKVLLQ